MYNNILNQSYKVEVCEIDSVCNSRVKVQTRTVSSYKSYRIIQLILRNSVDALLVNISFYLLYLYFHLMITFLITEIYLTETAGRSFFHLPTPKYHFLLYILIRHSLTAYRVTAAHNGFLYQ